jgi:peptidyl-prolyl cis-trans isomerase C
VTVPPSADRGPIGPLARGSRIGRLLREPLLWFLLAGAALFGFYRLLHPEMFTRDASNRIVITQDDLRQMSVTWLAQGRPPPTLAQWRSLIETKVREEVMFREAVALGLDRDDTIVKRRMVQKMDFLAQDVAAAREPTPAEVKAWFEDHKGRFAQPPRVSFRHVYFSFDKRNVRAGDDATRALQQLGGATVNAPALKSLGDAFMFQDDYAERTPDQMAKDFGPAFARSLFQLQPGAWQGPVESGYGWHVVFVRALLPERVPEFDEVAAEVKSDWIAEQGEIAKRRAYEAMRARYEVVLPESPAAAAGKTR